MKLQLIKLVVFKHRLANVGLDETGQFLALMFIPGTPEGEGVARAEAIFQVLNRSVTLEGTYNRYLCQHLSARKNDP